MHCLECKEEEQEVVLEVSLFFLFIISTCDVCVMRGWQETVEHPEHQLFTGHFVPLKTIQSLVIGILIYVPASYLDLQYLRYSGMAGELLLMST